MIIKLKHLKIMDILGSIIMYILSYQYGTLYRCPSENCTYGVSRRNLIHIYSVSTVKQLCSYMNGKEEI